MEIGTTRFGSVEINAEDIIQFPGGLIGFEDQHHWVILADESNEAVAWVQSTARPEVALPVVSPRRFAPHYRVRVARSQIGCVQLGATDAAYVLAIVGRDDISLTLNLRAPLIINLDRRIGSQVVTNDDQPVQHRIGHAAARLRKSA